MLILRTRGDQNPRARDGNRLGLRAVRGWPLNGLVPVAQFDQFEHLGQPAVQPGHEGDAAAFWVAVSRERDAYEAGVEDELIVRARAAPS
jgi:hypothetical protein